MNGYLERMRAGWVEVHVTGGEALAVVDRLTRSGQRVWAVRRRGGGLSFQLALTGIALLKDARRQTDAHVRFGRRGGWPLRLLGVRRRPFAWLGLMTAVLLVWVMTGRVWVIDTPGMAPGGAQRQQLVSAAEQAGLVPGVAIGSLDLGKLQAAMMRVLPQYAWIGVSVDGVVATLSAVPLQPRPPSPAAVRLVATRAGRVTQVSVYVGESAVAVGQWVKPGQTVIRGAALTEGPGSPTRRPVTVAEGQVWADVGYHVREVQPFRARATVDAPGQWTVRYVRAPGFGSVQLTGFGPVPYRHYREQRQIHYVWFGGVPLPVEWVVIKYRKTETRTLVYTRPSATAAALRAARRALASRIPAGGQIVRREQHIGTNRRGVTVELTWWINQNVAGAP